MCTLTFVRDGANVKHISCHNMNDNSLQKDLEGLGLSKNEASTYLALQQKGKTKAGELIRDTGLHRNLVYQALDVLAQKRLLTKSTMGGVALFQATDPIHLLDSLREQKLTAERIVDALKEQKKIVDQEITIYEGAEGLRAFTLKCAEVLEPGETIHVLGSGGVRFGKAMGAQALKKYYALIEKHGKAKILMYQTQQYTPAMYAMTQNSKKFAFRILPFDMTPAAGVVFTDHSVALLVYEDPIAVIEIKNQHLIDAYRNYFELLWNQEVRIEHGIDAIKRGFTSIVDELNPGDEYFSIGTQTGEPGSDLAQFFTEYHTKRVKKGVVCKLLSYKGDTEVIRDRYQKAGDPEEKVSFVKPLTQTGVGFIQTILYKNKVLIPIYGERPMTITFENAELYRGFKDYFDELWNQKTQTFEGYDGIIALCETVLQQREDLYLIAATGTILKTHGEYYSEFTERRVAHGIHLHMLANASTRGLPWAQLPYSTIAYLPPEFEGPMVVWVFGDYVANVIWQESPRVFLTKDRNTADAYRQQFKALKKVAKE